MAAGAGEAARAERRRRGLTRSPIHEAGDRAERLTEAFYPSPTLPMVGSLPEMRSGFDG